MGAAAARTGLALVALLACGLGPAGPAGAGARARIGTHDGGPVLEIAETGYAVVDGCASTGARSFAWSTTVGRFYGRCEAKRGVLCRRDGDCDWGDGDVCSDVQDQCRAHLGELPVRGANPLGHVTLALDGADCTAGIGPLCARVALHRPELPPLASAPVWSNLVQDRDRMEDPVRPKWPSPQTVVDYLKACRHQVGCHVFVGHDTPKNAPGQSEDLWRELRPVLARYTEAIERHNASCGADTSCRVPRDGILFGWRSDVLFKYDQERGCEVEASRHFDDADRFKVCGAPLGSGSVSGPGPYACPGDANSCVDTFGWFQGLSTRGGRDPVTRAGALGPLGLFVPARWADATYGFWGNTDDTVCSAGGHHHFGFGIDRAWHCGAIRRAPDGRCFGGERAGEPCRLADGEACGIAGSCLEAVPAAYGKTLRNGIHVTAPGLLDWRHAEARRVYVEALVELIEKGAGLGDHPERCVAWSWQGYGWVYWDRGATCGIDHVGCRDLGDPANSRTGLVMGRPGFDGGLLYPNPYGPGETEHYARALLLHELRQRLDERGLCVSIVPNFAKSMRGIRPRGRAAGSWDLPDPARRATAGHAWVQRNTAQATCLGGPRDGESCAGGAGPCEESGGACRLVGNAFNGAAPRVAAAPDLLEVKPGGKTELALVVEDDGRPLRFSDEASAGLRCSYRLGPGCEELELEVHGDDCAGARVVAGKGARGACTLEVQASDHDRFARVDSGSRRSVAVRVVGVDGGLLEAGR